MKLYKRRMEKPKSIGIISKFSIFIGAVLIIFSILLGGILKSLFDLMHDYDFGIYFPLISLINVANQNILMITAIISLLGFIHLISGVFLNRGINFFRNLLKKIYWLEFLLIFVIITIYLKFAILALQNNKFDFISFFNNYYVFYFTVLSVVSSISIMLINYFLSKENVRAFCKK